MAWHIIHSLLEMVRSHSTFPGKLWIILMFVFRILVVARIGDNVYYDEQDQFFCNTQTPGCNQVCFNAFSPISQLRFWSLMVLTVSTPGILFFIYATHKIYHASIKIESQNIQQQQDNDDRAPSNDKLPSNKDLESLGSYLHPPGGKKRKRRVTSDTAPTYKECIIKRDDSSLYREIPRSRENSRSEVRRRKRKELYGGGGENAKEFRSFDGTTVKLLPIDDRSSTDRPSLPVYEEIVQGRRRGFVKANQTKSNGKGEVPQLKMLENKILYRAYWWHVLFRSILEGGFLYLQWWLYGFEVSELFVCHRMPCSQPTDCYISRPTEKTVLLYIMFSLGSISALLSVMEFYTLGWRRFRNSVICCLATEPSDRENISHDKIMLARFNEKRNDDATKKDDVKMNIPHTGLSQYVGGRGMKCDGLSLDSASSNTTIESV